MGSILSSLDRIEVHTSSTGRREHEPWLSIPDMVPSYTDAEQRLEYQPGSSPKHSGSHPPSRIQTHHLTSNTAHWDHCSSKSYLYFSISVLT